MKKNILLIASGSFLTLHSVSATAQEAPPAEVGVEAEATTKLPGTTATQDTDTRAGTSETGEVSTDTTTTQTLDAPAVEATVIASENDEDGPASPDDHAGMDHSSEDAGEEEALEPAPEAN